MPPHARIARSRRSTRPRSSSATAASSPRTADSALPSLFEACHEEPYARESPGFGQWPATKFPWFGQLGARGGHLILAVHRGKSLLVTDEVAGFLDPICRAELERMAAAEEGWAQLLEHLADAGPRELEDLQTELALTPKELKSLRSPLERCGAVVARPLVYEEPAPAHEPPPPLGPGAPGAERRERPAAGARRPPLRRRSRSRRRTGARAPRWFSWRWYWDDGLTDELVESRRLVRVDGHLAAG